MQQVRFEKEHLIISSRLLQFYPYRTMVGAGNITSDKRPFKPRSKSGRNQKVIYTPSNIPSAGAVERTPPGVMAAGLFKLSKSIHETSFDICCETGPFLGRETVGPHVGLGIGEVQLGMRHVEVAAKNHRLVLFEIFKVPEKRPVPF